jgi:hypothetical protein
MAKTPAWQRKEGKNPKGGLNAKGRARTEGSTAGGRPTPRLFLRPYERDEEKVDERKNRKRSEFED